MKLLSRFVTDGFGLGVVTCNVMKRSGSKWSPARQLALLIVKIIGQISQHLQLNVRRTEFVGLNNKFELAFDERNSGRESKY